MVRQRLIFYKFNKSRIDLLLESIVNWVIDMKLLFRSAKFHDFIKESLTKNCQRRPTAGKLLQVIHSALKKSHYIVIKRSQFFYRAKLLC